MTVLSPSMSRGVLADVVPGARVRDAALVLGGAGFVGLASQLSVPLPFTPVPLSLSTFAVLLVGAGLGWQRALPSLLLFMVAGMAGVPWFADASSGWAMPSFGYIVGYVAAATLVGHLARSGGDRTPLRTFGLMTLGSLTIYAFGVPWLAVSLDLGLGQALTLGLVPFLVGDLIKTAAASALLPGAWAWVDRRGS